MRNRYTETYNGTETVRSERPIDTFRWLDIRIKHATNACRMARLRLEEGIAQDVGGVERRRLMHGVEAADAFLTHANATKRAFAKEWTPGEGYIDPENWESTEIKRAEEARVAAARHAAILAEHEREEEDTEEETEALETEAAGPVPLAGKRSATGRGDSRPLAVAPPTPITPRRDDDAIPAGRRRPAPAAEPSTGLEAPDPPPPRVMKSYKGMKNTPPDETKFVKGERSPNPKGRPKGRKNFATLAREVLGQPVKIAGRKGRRRTVPVALAIMEVHVRKALGGDSKSFAQILPLLQSYLVEEVTEKRIELTDEERSMLRNQLKLSKLIDPDGNDDEGEDA